MNTSFILRLAQLLTGKMGRLLEEPSTGRWSEQLCVNIPSLLFEAEKCPRYPPPVKIFLPILCWVPRSFGTRCCSVNLGSELWTLQIGKKTDKLTQSGSSVHPGPTERRSAHEHSCTRWPTNTPSTTQLDSVTHNPVQPSLTVRQKGPHKPFPSPPKGW